MVVDSGSDPQTMQVLREFPIVLHEIPNSEFNHGLTRDLAAGKASGEFLIFINQDAEPVDERWLEQLIQPLLDDETIVATQGGILEREDFPRFYWDTGGPRFYFSSESKTWIQRYHGMGFSTVNCAIRRSAWQQHPFGRMATFEDKGFQRRVHHTGKEIVYADGWVYHSHDYDLGQLRRRCREEGLGWRLVGEEYTWPQALRDSFLPRNYLDLALGLLRGRVKKLSEVAYPLLRPLWVYQGNHTD